MSDNGLRSDEELFLEVIEMFGLDQDVLQPIQENSFVDNKRVQNTSTLKSIIKQHTSSFNQKDEAGEEYIDVDAY